MIYLLVASAIALTVPGFVLAVRALPWVEARVLDGVKPWACDVCSCFWATALFATCAAGAASDWRLALCAGPAYTIALVVLSHLERPVAFPALPDAPGLAEKLEPPP
jgi:hypothetical protein